MEWQSEQEKRESKSMSNSYNSDKNVEGLHWTVRETKPDPVTLQPPPPQFKPDS